IEQKQKYAVWKAADIRKAIKEGRRPEPGPPGGDQDLSGPVDLSWEGDISPEQLRQENPQASQPKISTTSVPDGGVKPEPSSQFPRNIQHYSADKMEPPPAFSAPDHQTAGPHSQAPQEFSQHSQINPTAFSPSYFNVPGRPQDAQGGQLGPGYSYSMPSSSHDTMNDSQPRTLNYQSYPTMHDGSLDAQPASHIPYPSNASYYQNVNGNHPNSIPYHVNTPSNPEFQSNLQYNSVSGRNGAYVESAPIERTTSAPASAPAPAYSYDSSYQPPPEKIAEAHKAARFAVGALAFDDVPTAVDHLKRSLELLTLPSTGL
ncbi:hypothetical protein KI387_041981, partial [Taxus chinensis]